MFERSTRKDNQDGENFTSIRTNQNKRLLDLVSKKIAS